ncbi:hypothetical protein CMV_027577 [Castanea mollissima]|uniref:Citrate transporter-like domain-containing protein n=1 Tax=Castanea mollissima TaxID=60419 RepID=A0A8J4VEX7_9ROSI|nr:hypothetical protein CMV_027577 [Castanea mollissima]
MVLASSVKVVLGSIAFAIFWVLAVFPTVPFLPIGRTAGSLLGGMLMVIFQVITPDQAYHAIDLQILGLLFGTMVVSVYLERADMFKQHNLPPHPFLLALASSANIGSAATQIGNPQNLVIAIKSKIPFGKFLIGLLPAMIMGVIVNTLLLLCMYWKSLSIEKDEEDLAAELIAEEEVNSHRFSPATMSHFTSFNSQEWNSRLEVMALQSSPSMSIPIRHVENLRNRTIPSENEIQGVLSGSLESARISNASKEAANDVSSQVKEETIPSKRISSMDRLRDVLSVLSSVGKDDLTRRWKKMLWKPCVTLLL